MNYYGDPNSTYGEFMSQGNSDIEFERYGSARDAFSKALALNPSSVAARSNRGLMHFYLKDYQLALADADHG